ncbi:MAG: ComEC/Rec2 family competence protein [Microthrixaceae bacterium]
MLRSPVAERRGGSLARFARQVAGIDDLVVVALALCGGLAVFTSSGFNDGGFGDGGFGDGGFGARVPVGLLVVGGIAGSASVVLRLVVLGPVGLRLVGLRLVGLRSVGLRSVAPALPRLLGVVALTCVFCSLVGVRASQDLRGLEVGLPERLDGVAQLASDPVTGRFGTNVEVVAEGRRWYAAADRDVEWAFLESRAGDLVRLGGSVSSFEDAPREWVLSRHLSGRVRVTEAAPLGPGQPWFVAANAVHELLERGAASMEGQHRALYLGLVVGDDRGQDEMTGFRFRASGLTHLLAVSGQNMAFVLVALSPLLARLPLRWRWVLGVAAVAGFMLVTRAEPSVLRAGTMAALALVATALGRPMPGIRLVSMAVCVLLVADPLLVYSVGFRLSLAATTSLVVFAHPLVKWIPGPGFIARPLAVTLAAQLGAIPVMALTFGPASVLAIPANLLAEPAAGAVMTLGMTTGLLSGLVREELAWVLQIPVRVAVWWIDSVAGVTASLSAPPLGLTGWVVLGLAAAGAVCLFGRSEQPTRPGSALVVIVAPMLVLLGPPDPPVGEMTVSVDLGADAALVGTCGAWSVTLAGDRSSAYMAPDRIVAIVESLWTMGITRVRAVSGPGAAVVARELHGSVVEPAARGSPCGR